ncbi:hypothetical protein D3C81_1273530 [compost metagenome]
MYQNGIRMSQERRLIHHLIRKLDISAWFNFITAVFNQLFDAVIAALQVKLQPDHVAVVFERLISAAKTDCSRLNFIR